MKKKVAIIIVSAILIAFTMFAGYYIVGAKDYDVYVDLDIGEPQVVILDCEKGHNEDSSIWIYDEDTVKEMYDIVYGVKGKPYWSMYEKEDADNFFSIDVMGENNRHINISASDYGEYYVASLDASIGRGFLETNIWNFTGKVIIDKEAGDKLFELVDKRYKEYACNISTENIVDISKNSDTDFRKLLQYKREEFELDIPLYFEDEDESVYSYYIFPIEGKKGYAKVWSIENNSLDCETGVYTEESVILQAWIYNEKDEYIDMYDECVGEFLEEME